MNTPPLLLLAALAFWGWRTGLIIHGVTAGVVLEASRHLALRWDFSEKELKRIWDLCVLLLIGALAYTYFSEDAVNPTFLSVQWLPLLFLPIMLAQAFGHLEKIPTSTFFLIRIPRPRPQTENELQAINISHAYFGLCLLAAGAVKYSNATQESLEYFVGICVLLIWALWPQRARRFSPATWACLFTVVLGFTYSGAIGLRNLQRALEGRISELISSLIRQDMDPRESRTSIGKIRELKQSGRIVLRVEASKGTAPDLLRKACFDNYQATSWSSSARDFNELELGKDDGFWRLLANKSLRHEVIVASYLTKGSTTLALPMGTAEIDNLPVNILRTNLLGTVQAAQGPGLVRYLARFGPGSSLDGDVSLIDTLVPSSETNALAKVAAELNLVHLPAPEAARRLASYFQQHFSYTLDLRQTIVRNTEGLTSVGCFLLKTRTGHCEYFATSTALLLRYAGIPARYVVGYSVQESAGPHKYVVRERHAHAWVIYFDKLSGLWRELDTTPSGWGAFEDSQAGWWEPIQDLLSGLWFNFSSWRWLTERSTMQRYIFGLLVPLIGILTYRLLTAKRRRRLFPALNANSNDSLRPGLDSELFLIEARLAELGLAREPWETLGAWMARLQRDAACPAAPAALQMLLDLHYRYRFDPTGLTGPERLRLRDLAQTWLDEIRRLPSKARSVA